MVTPAPGAPQLTPGMAQIPMITSGEKDPSESKPFKPYLAVLWSGVENVMFELDVSSDFSAVMAGYFLATRHYPNVHTVGVWKKKGPNPEDVVDPPLLYLMLAGLDAECSPTITKLTGQTPAAAPGVAPGGQTGGSTPGAIPLKTTEQGFEKMYRQAKDAKRGGKA